eukprot:TRINITY_DN10735_c0_g2_i2.p2 TRINITY_DN10735_c0_g2~~TRINITY_DN10735_c0_g2_i2.p2  ORF type:complete len:108 (-),score=28.25 TRINITY_DN10735_c0_g2_i2:246-569(-)
MSHTAHPDSDLAVAAVLSGMNTTEASRAFALWAEQGAALTDCCPVYCIVCAISPAGLKYAAASTVASVGSTKTLPPTRAAQHCRYRGSLMAVHSSSCRLTWCTHTKG